MPSVETQCFLTISLTAEKPIFAQNSPDKSYCKVSDLNYSLQFEYTKRQSMLPIVFLYLETELSHEAGATGVIVFAIEILSFTEVDLGSDLNARCNIPKDIHCAIEPIFVGCGIYMM